MTPDQLAALLTERTEVLRGLALLLIVLGIVLWRQLRWYKQCPDCTHCKQLRLDEARRQADDRARYDHQWHRPDKPLVTCPHCEHEPEKERE